MCLTDTGAVRALQAAGERRLEARPRAHLRKVKGRVRLDSDPQEAAACAGRRGRFFLKNRLLTSKDPQFKKKYFSTEMELCCRNGEPIQFDSSEALPTFDALFNAVYKHHQYGGAVPIKLRIRDDVFVEVDSACEEFACKVVAAYNKTDS